MIGDRIELVEMCACYYLSEKLPDRWYESLTDNPHDFWKFIKSACYDEHCEREPEAVWWDIIWVARDMNKRLMLGFDMRGIR
jgi:hypothetical protein